ncbi:MAG: PAS domain S-box protein [Candidatus Lokiarchaeota archaeon]|nr:PAS domain S-box protein [Candidatus Lokiarchaeota archaeon]
MISDNNNKITNFENIFPFFMETVEDLIVITSTDNSFKIEYVHECKFLEQLGYTDGFLIGKSLLNLVDFEDNTQQNDLLRIIQQNKDTHDVKVLHKNGKFTWAELISTIFSDEKNQQKLIIRLRDISKIKELEIKLEETENYIKKISKLEDSEKKYRDNAELLPDVIFETDLNLTLTYVNSIAFDKFGYTKEDLRAGLKITQIVDPESLEEVSKNIKLLLKGRDTLPHKYLLVKKDGSKFYAMVHSKPILKNEQIIGIRGTITDINNLVLAEKELKESEEKFRTIAEQSLMGICIIQDFEIKYLNHQMAEIYGYPIDEVKRWKPKEFIKVIHPDSKEMVINQLTKKQQGSEDVIIHYIAKIIKKNGNIRYVENYSKPIMYQGRPADLLTQIDITAKMNAEQKLSSSEEKYRHLYENSPNAILLFNLSGEILDCNLISEDMSGFKKDDIIGKSFQNINFIPQTFLPSVLDDFKALLKGKAMEPREIQLYNKEGTLIWVNYQASLFDYENEKIIQIIIQNVDEKKKAEQKLKESEEKYRSLFENMNAGFAYHKVIVNDNNDPIDYQYLEVNPAFERLTGMKKEDLIGKTVTEAIPGTENDPADWIGKYGNVGLTGIPLVVEDYSEALDKWFKVSGYSPKKGYFAVTFTDITDRKKAEEKLITSEEKYRKLFENSPIALMEQDYSEMKRYVDNLKASGINDFEKYFDENTEEVLKFMTMVKVIDVNMKTLEVYKASNKKDFILRMNQLGDNIMTEEVLLDNKMEMLSFINGDLMYESEIVSKTFTGDLIYLYAKTSIVPGFESTWSKVIISIIDITDKKLTEQRLKESEEKYHKLFETSPDGVILTDLKGNIIECNSAIEHISGYSPREFIGKNFIKLDIYYENGLEQLLEGYRDLLEDNQIDAVEFPIKRKDNQINWVQVRSTLINMKGQTYILAVIHDVTTQKQAEEAIKRSEEKFRDLLESSSVGVVEIDVIKKEIIYLNPKLEEIIGYVKEELTEDHFLNKLIHPKDLRKLLDSNEEAELEFRIFDKSGKLKWLTGKRIPRFNENGQIISIRVWLEDITEKKMYENLIYELNVNFLNFTADIKYNIQLLLNTCLNLLNGDFILYINKTELEGKDTFQILTSDNKSFMCDAEFFADDLFVSALFYESHDFPQTFFDINKMSFANTDPFIARYNLKGCFGKLIKSQNDLESAVCVFYRQNPDISNQDKLVMFLICDAIEIEQRRWQVQRGLEEQNITLNKINKLKTELFSRTSHELKTPLISIKGFTELLLTIHRPKLDNDIISILEEIKDGSKRLEKIIKLLLESTKLEAGQLELNLSKENLNFLINFCVKELKGLAKLRNQSINLKLHDILETEFDKERIYEVISNLLVNAIKYTPPNGNIDIESEIRDGFFLISVKDNGIGFTSEEKNQTFKQFGKIERYGQGWDVAIEGTGLGLYITKKLVELHGGKIWLESEGRNKGSSFYFTIPIKN